jgi:rhodanese-related sulfurtransferase
MPNPRGERHEPLNVAARAAAVLAAGAILGIAVNAVHPRGVRFGSAAAAAARCVQPGAEAAGAGVAAAPAVEVLSLSQVAHLCGDPRALVADARSSREFEQGHVAGAIHLPCASSRGEASAALDLLADKDTLVVYGNGTGDALPVADEMRRRGGRPGVRIAVLAGGFPAWSQAGLACSSGPCADCAVRP